jgi:hypothetical protein
VVLPVDTAVGPGFPVAGIAVRRIDYGLLDMVGAAFHPGDYIAMAIKAILGKQGGRDEKGYKKGR